jgi:hypothetical protein
VKVLVYLSDVLMSPDEPHSYIPYSQNAIVPKESSIDDGDLR